MATRNFRDVVRDLAISETSLEVARKEARRALPLASLRADAGLTQAEMSGRLHTTQGAVSRFETRPDFLLSTLQRYMDALGGDMEVILTTAASRYRLVKSADDNSSFSLEPQGITAHLRRSYTFVGGVSHGESSRRTRFSSQWKRHCPGTSDVTSPSAFTENDDAAQPIAA